MGILDDILGSIPEETDPKTPPPAAEDEEKVTEDNTWYSDDFKKYAKIG